MGIFSIFSKKNKDESSEIKKNEESVKVQTNDDVLSENKEKIKDTKKGRQHFGDLF